MDDEFMKSEEAISFVSSMFMGFTEQEQKENLDRMIKESNESNPYLK